MAGKGNTIKRYNGKRGMVGKGNTIKRYNGKGVWQGKGIQSNGIAEEGYGVQKGSSQTV